MTQSITATILTIDVVDYVKIHHLLCIVFRGDDLTTILKCVNNDVSRKEATTLPGEKKQMPEVRFTLRKSLVLSPATEAPSQSDQTKHKT